MRTGSKSIFSNPLQLLKIHDIIKTEKAGDTDGAESRHQRIAAVL